MTGSTQKHPAARVLTVAVRMAVISFVTVELTLRLLQPVEFRAPTLTVPLTAGEQRLFRRSEVPGLLYEMAPGVEKLIEGAWVRTNSLGMRGPEPVDAPEVVRLAVLGDSFTFALGVPVEQGYPAVLERLLDTVARASPATQAEVGFGPRAAGFGPESSPTAPRRPCDDVRHSPRSPPRSQKPEARSLKSPPRCAGDAAESSRHATTLESSSSGGSVRYEVLNFGVPGYSTWEEAVVLEQRVMPLRPQVVIVGYFLNDPETDPLQPLHVHFHPVSWWQHFHTLRLIALLELTFEMRRAGTPDYYEFLHAPGGRKWPGVPEAFRRMRALTAASGIPVLVVLFPANDFASWSDYRYAALHGQVAAAATEAGLQVLDLLPVYARYEPAQLRIGAADDHPSAMGHRVAAEAIAERLRAESWLGAPAPDAR